MKVVRIRIRESQKEKVGRQVILTEEEEYYSSPQLAKKFNERFNETISNKYLNWWFYKKSIKHYNFSVKCNVGGTNLSLDDDLAKTNKLIYELRSLIPHKYYNKTRKLCEFYDSYYEYSFANYKRFIK